MSAFIDEHPSERVVEAERLLELVRATYAAKFGTDAACDARD